MIETFGMVGVTDLIGLLKLDACTIKIRITHAPQFPQKYRDRGLPESVILSSNIFRSPVIDT